MAKLRRARVYRPIDRPYTRISKFKKKAFVRMSPPRKVTRYDMGEPNKHFSHMLELVPKDTLQIRQEAIESARQTSIRLLERRLAKNAFHFKIRKYPYHILREKSLAMGAGADRVSTGMQKPFGKPVGVAVQLKAGDRFFTVEVDEASIETARAALKRASKKMPCSFSIKVAQNKAATQMAATTVAVTATAA